MHLIEPHYGWRNEYVASEDERSPFYRRQYSEFEFTHAVYNHLIHPQWDDMGSATLYIKLLYVNYDSGHCVIEMIGEWNDCLYNDIMYLKRNIAEPLMKQGINSFLLIGENVFNFHSSDDAYYEEWFEEVENGWIVAMNFRDFVIREMESARLDWYMAIGKPFQDVPWRKLQPGVLCTMVGQLMARRLNP